MKIWFQLVSSTTRMKDFLLATQQQVNRVADPGTTVEVHGTKQGALADQFRFFEHLDTSGILENVVKLRKGGYDAMVIGNSLDMGLYEAREMLDIPVFSLLETTILYASMMGERFGLIVPNWRFIPRYRDLVVRYRQDQRLAAIVGLGFTHLPELNRLFTEPEVADKAIESIRAAGREAIAQGAEVLIPCGLPITLIAMREVRDIDGVPILEGYTLLVKVAEMAVKLKNLGHPFVSRYRLFNTPPDSLIQQARAAWDLDL